MPSHPGVSRRRVLKLTGSAALATGLAGCADGGQDGESPTPTTAAPTSTAGETETPTSDELDLREANVVGVDMGEADGSYRFSVTLHHDDDGEPGYADWWQVEGLDGTQLGRRDLAHPHSEQPFTRSATIDIPDGVSCVVVRGHDETHGYGGLAMLVDVDSGETRSVQQEADPSEFSPSDCP